MQRLGCHKKEGIVKVYVASSWRNEHRQQAVVKDLRHVGHEVYDFRNPLREDLSFHWSDIDPEWKNWLPSDFRHALNHLLAQEGFNSDMEAMEWADACVLVMPCGRSAHLEAGLFMGAGKPCLILLADGEPELMYKMAVLCLDIHEVQKALTEIEP